MFGRCSLRTGIFLGRQLGSLFYRLAGRRRHIAEVNLRLCLPELNQQQAAGLIKSAMQNSFIALFEMAIGWTGNLDKYYATMDVVGLESVFSCLAAGRSVILAGCHQTTLDIGLILLGRKLGNRAHLSASYRVYPDALFNQFMQSSRTRYLKALIGSRDTRAMIGQLRQKNTIFWIAVDQDVGGKSSVYAPFFGVNASTHNSVPRLAAITGAAVFSFASYREKLNYRLEFKHIEQIPSGDLIADVNLQNRHVEAVIRKNPDQYLWMHRRFKTQPGHVRYYD